MRISDWSSDVCSSDLSGSAGPSRCSAPPAPAPASRRPERQQQWRSVGPYADQSAYLVSSMYPRPARRAPRRSEEHTSELQSLMRISYAVFCLKKKKKYDTTKITIMMSKYNQHQQP